MENETKNIMAIQAYLETNSTVKHLSKVFTVFHADVVYKDDVYDDVCLKDQEIMFQHSFNNDVTIKALSPPYYSNFWFSQQHFEFRDGKLYITGAHHDDSTKKYIIIIGNVK